MSGKERKFAASSDEYTQLRQEMTQLHISIRILWGSLFAIFFAAIGVLVGLTGTLSRESLPGVVPLFKFIEAGGLNLASFILIALLGASMYLAYLWLRHAYYIGSYIVIFHERDNPDIQWLTRNRNIRSSKLRKFSMNISTGLVRSGMILFFFALFPAGAGAFHVISHIGLCNASRKYWVTLISIILPIVFLFLQFRKLRKSRDERKEIEAAWKEERDNLLKMKTPVTPKI